MRTDGARIVGVGAGPAPSAAGASALAGGEPRVVADLVIPGLISAHQHLLDRLLRGAPLGDGFLDWLLGLYYAGLSRATPEDCGLATTAGMIDTLQAGITTVVDCWGVDNGDDPGRVTACASASLDAHVRSGARVIFGRMLAEQVPEAWLTHPRAAAVARLGSPASGSLDQVAALARAFGSDRVAVTPAPELPELMTPTGLQDSLALAAELGVVMPIHLCPSPESRSVYGPEELAAIGVLDARLLGAHCIAVSGPDVAALAAAGVRVAHCPTANRALRGGVAGPATTPVVAFRAAGAPVGLGLDNASLNPQTDLLAEARQAIWSAGARGDRLGPEDVFAMATTEGARAVGLEGEIGSLTVGKRADLVGLDTGGEHWWPHESWVSALVWQARPSDVRTVMVDGEVVVADGRCLTLRVDRPALMAASRRLRDAAASR